METSSKGWQTAVTFATVLIASGLSACASVPDCSDDRLGIRSIAYLVDEPVYVQLDGAGRAPEGEFRRTDEKLYLSMLTDELRASGLFPSVEIWSDAAPEGALVVNAHVHAQIDMEHSWTNAAWLMIVPVKTEGRVAVTFQLKRDQTVVESRRYSETAQAFAVPAAEFAGHTWVEKSGVLSTLVHRFVDDMQINLVWRARAMQRVVAN